MENIAAPLTKLAEPLDGLTPLPGNPRLGNVQAVAKSLKRFGQRKPIVVNADNVIIAGNHTFLAAQELGWKKIATVRVDDDSETAAAYALADNRTADLGTYDDELLSDLLHTLDDLPDLLENISYTIEDIELIDSQIINAEPLPSWEDGFSSVPGEEKTEIGTMKFTLHETQVEMIKRALEIAKPKADTTLNQNVVGSSLAVIVEEWMSQNG